MAGNALLTINMITREAVRLFMNSNVFIQNIDRQYDSAFAQTGAKIGQSIRIRLPNDYTVSDGPALSLQDTNEQFTTLNLTSQKHVDVAFTSVERTMSLDDYSDRILRPMMNNLVGKVAQTVMNASEGGVCNFVSNVDGSGFIISPTQSQFLQANAVLDDNSADMDYRKVVNDPTTDARTVSSLTGLLNPTPNISEQYRTGKMKSGLGYDMWMRDQTVIKHTTGTFSAGGAMSSAGQSGTTITVSAITGTFRAGDIITIDGVNAVNRVTKQDLGTLRQFVVTANVLTGATSIPIYPALISSNAGADVQYQTVATANLNGAQIRLVNKAGEVYRKSIAYVREAVTMGTADLYMPTRGVIEASRAVYDGVSLRILTAYMIGSDQAATRCDVLFGQLYTRPEWLTIVADKV